MFAESCIHNTTKNTQKHHELVILLLHSEARASVELVADFSSIAGMLFLLDCSSVNVTGGSAVLRVIV
jgi:hypothetical protein